MRTLVLTIPAIVSIVTAAACKDDALTCDNDTETVALSLADACELALQHVTDENGSDGRCPDSCAAKFSACTIEDAYMSAFRQANPTLKHDMDAGAITPVCPTAATDKVKVECSVMCEGRRTANIDEPTTRARSVGEYFATCAYLEATSVLAFERMYAELMVHGAPAEILERVGRARREEERHVELTMTLARRYGFEPAVPVRESFAIRPLFEIARENLVEGCIRETWGAVLARFRAERAADRDVRRAAREIAEDETRHAELAWDVAAWLEARLSEEQSAALREAVDETIAALSHASEEPNEHVLTTTGLPTAEERATLLELLERHVYRAA